MPDTRIAPLRSVLYMPASNARAIDKARGLDCDAVVLDLEDAVAPEEKDAARACAFDAIRAGGFGRRQVVLRINGSGTSWEAADIAALHDAGAGALPDAVLVPKVSSAADVHRYHALLAGLPETMALWVMIETARSIFHLAEIAGAAATTRLTTFVLGTNDLVRETGARLVAGRAALLGPLGLVVTAARMADLAVIDGVFNGLDDDDGLAAECRQGLEFGFDGKTLIHPRQIAIANAAFTPTPAEVEQAQAVIDAFAAPENTGKGAIRLNAQMYERLHLHRCETLVGLAPESGEFP